MAALTAGDTSALGFDSRSCDAAGSAMAMALRHGHTLAEANAAAHAAALAIFKGYSPMGAEVLLASSERSWSLPSGACCLLRPGGCFPSLKPPEAMIAGLRPS